MGQFNFSGYDDYEEQIEEQIEEPITEEIYDFHDSEEYKLYKKQLAIQNGEIEDTDEETDNSLLSMFHFKEAVSKHAVFLVFFGIMLLLSIFSHFHKKDSSSESTGTRLMISEEQVEKMGLTDEKILKNEIIKEILTEIEMAENETKQEISDNADPAIETIEESSETTENIVSNEETTNESYKPVQYQEAVYQEFLEDGSLQLLVNDEILSLKLIGVDESLHGGYDLLETNQTIYIEYDVNKYNFDGQIVAYLWLENPKNLTEENIESSLLNALVLKNGIAKLSTDKINTRYENILINAEDYAIYHKIGCWEDNK